MLATFRPGNGITLTISSNAEKISLVCEALHALCLYASGSPACALEVQHAAVEALNNVIIHAYHNQPNHEIIVRWSQEERLLRIEIIDTGTSMTFLPKPLLPDFAKEGSRGWWIINACVDDYYYQTIGQSEQAPLLRPGEKYPAIAALTAQPHQNILTFMKRF
jgi:anti-sigma regulatory factor (Ser/Thr protein kinase)